MTRVSIGLSLIQPAPLTKSYEKRCFHLWLKSYEYQNESDRFYRRNLRDDDQASWITITAILHPSSDFCSMYVTPTRSSSVPSAVKRTATPVASIAVALIR